MRGGGGGGCVYVRSGREGQNYTLYTNHDRQGVVVSIYQHFKNETRGKKTLTNDRLPEVLYTETNPRSVRRDRV